MRPAETTDIFIREDLSKPENRINVAMFGLMTQDWFRTWFLERLDLSTDAVVYPPVNESGKRPDFRVDSFDGSVLARIEVELGADPGQVANYAKTFAEPVKSVFGRRSHGGDLSLEDIANRLAQELSRLEPQTRINVEHLRIQIIQALRGHSSSSARAEVSDKMRENPLVAGLTERLGAKLMFTTGPVPSGYLKADTNAKQGFSLRVNSRESKSGTLSLLFISGGRPQVGFPARAKLERYLPRHKKEVDAYAQLLSELGLEIDEFGENQRPSLRLNKVVTALDRLSDCVLALADRPSTS